MESNCVEDLFPAEDIDPNSSCFANGMMKLTDPIDAYDSSKIKIATDMIGYGLYMTHFPIPFPKGRSDFKLKKCWPTVSYKKVFEFVNKIPRRYLESIEDIDKFRFYEHGIK